MKYLHTSQNSNLKKLWIFVTSLVKVRKFENTNGRFTLVFLKSRDIQNQENGITVPLIEITYN